MKAGDEVVWTSGSKRGRIVSLRWGYGTIVSIDGDEAVVKRKYSNGKTRKKLADLSLRDNAT